MQRREEEQEQGAQQPVSLDLKPFWLGLIVVIQHLYINEKLSHYLSFKYFPFLLQPSIYLALHIFVEPTLRK